MADIQLSCSATGAGSIGSESPSAKSVLLNQVSRGPADRFRPVQGLGVSYRFQYYSENNNALRLKTLALPNHARLGRGVYINMGVALQCILYSDLRPRSR